MATAVIKTYIRKLKSVESIKVLLVCFLAYIAAHTMIVAVGGSITGEYAGHKLAKDVIIFTLALFYLIAAIVDKKQRQWLIIDKLNILVFLYALIHIILFIHHSMWSEKAAYAGLIFNLRFFAAYILVRIFIKRHDLVQKIPTLPEFMLKSSLLICLIVALLGVFQVVFLPKEFLSHFGYDGVKSPMPYSMVDDQSNFLRAFSTLRGPNELGAYLILALSLVLIAQFKRNQSHYRNVIALTVVIIALVLTHSRSAIIGCICALSYLVAYRFRASISKAHIMLATLIFILVCAMTISLSFSIPALRLFIFHSTSGDKSLIEGSTGDHLVAMQIGIKDALSYPLGQGPGMAGTASFYLPPGQSMIAENYYIQIAQEAGLAGSMIFIAICAAVTIRLMKSKMVLSQALAASMIGISVTAIFLHTWSDETIAYTWWILAAIALSWDERDIISINS